MYSRFEFLKVALINLIKFKKIKLHNFAFKQSFSSLFQKKSRVLHASAKYTVVVFVKLQSFKSITIRVKTNSLETLIIIIQSFKSIAIRVIVFIKNTVIQIQQ